MYAMKKLKLSNLRFRSINASLVLSPLLFMVLIAGPSVVGGQPFYLPFTSSDIANDGGVKVDYSEDPNLAKDDIIEQVVRDDATSQVKIKSAADLLQKAIARRDTSNGNSFSVYVRNRNIWTQIKLRTTPVTPPAKLKLPFGGTAVSGGVRVSGSSTNGVNNNDIISFVAKPDHNGMKPVTAMNDLLSNANAKMDGNNRVTVYNKSTSQWVSITLVPTKPAAKLADKLGSFTERVSGGLRVDTPKHAGLLRGDIIDSVSIPDNWDFLSGKNVTNVSTLAELEAALTARADSSGRVAVHYKRARTLGGFVHISVK